MYPDLFELTSKTKLVRYVFFPFISFFIVFLKIICIFYFIYNHVLISQNIVLHSSLLMYFLFYVVLKSTKFFVEMSTYKLKHHSFTGKVTYLSTYFKITGKISFTKAILIFIEKSETPFKIYCTIEKKYFQNNSVRCLYSCI